MIKFCDLHANKYKRPLLFKLSLRLINIELYSQKRSNLQFELLNNKSIIHSKKFHNVSPGIPKTNLDEEFHIPVIVYYDPRKKRFAVYNIQINILSNHTRFSRKMATTVFQLSQMLNAGVLYSKEKLKLAKCTDKNSFLEVRAELELRDIEDLNEGESLDDSYLISSVLK